MGSAWPPVVGATCWEPPSCRNSIPQQGIMNFRIRTGSRAENAALAVFKGRLHLEYPGEYLKQISIELRLRTSPTAGQKFDRPDVGFRFSGLDCGREADGREADVSGFGRAPGMGFQFKNPYTNEHISGPGQPGGPPAVGARKCAPPYKGLSLDPLMGRRGSETPKNGLYEGFLIGTPHGAEGSEKPNLHEGPPPASRGVPIQQKNLVWRKTRGGHFSGFRPPSAN